SFTQSSPTDIYTLSLHDALPILRTLPDFLINGCGKMISPIAVDAYFDLEFDRLATQSFGDLHLFHFELAACCLVWARTVLVCTPVSSTTTFARRRISSGIRHCCLRSFTAVVFTTK